MGRRWGLIVTIGLALGAAPMAGAGEPPAAPDAAPRDAATQPPLPSTAPLRLCAPERETVDYRACVNASTRNRAAKIRQA